MNEKLTCYGHSYNRLKECEQCQYKAYCKDSTKLGRTHIEYTQKDQMEIEIEPITNLAKASNISGALISELLKLSDFNPLKFYCVIMRLGNCTYKQIGRAFGVSDVAVYKYCESMPKVLKEYLKTKAITMLELEEAFNNKPQPEALHFQKTLKRMVKVEMEESEKNHPKIWSKKLTEKELKGTIKLKKEWEETMKELPYTAKLASKQSRGIDNG